jgi:hypothetical protein
MGFLFTLASLGISLLQSAKDSFATENIISNFGVALITTILGVAGRVTFSQLRDTPQEIENESLNSVSDAARELKKQLDEIVTDFNIFRTTVKQSTNEMHVEWTHSLKNQLVETQNYYEKHFEEIKHKHTEIVDQIDIYNNSIGNISSAINSIEIPQDVFKNHLKSYLSDFNSYFKKFQTSLDDKIKKVDRSASIAIDIVENVKLLSDSVKSISDFTNNQIALSKQSVVEMINYVESFKVFIDQNSELIENAVINAESKFDSFSEIFHNLSLEAQKHTQNLLTQHELIIKNISAIDDGLGDSVIKQNELIRSLIIKDLPYFSTALRDKVKEIENVSLLFSKLYESSEQLHELIKKSITTSDYSINGMNIVSNKIDKGFNELQAEFRSNSTAHLDNERKIISSLEKLGEVSERSTFVLEEMKNQSGKIGDNEKHVSDRKWYNFNSTSQR